jgi:hypothetical protein
MGPGERLRWLLSSPSAALVGLVLAAVLVRL